MQTNVGLFDPYHARPAIIFRLIAEAVEEVLRSARIAVIPLFMVLARAFDDDGRPGQSSRPSFL